MEDIHHMITQYLEVDHAFGTFRQTTTKNLLTVYLYIKQGYSISLYKQMR